MFENFFQKLFGRRNNNCDPPNQGFEDHRQYGDRFRNPIWQTDDDDDDEAGDFRNLGTGMHFNIFTDPFEITRYFESQMDNMLQDFLRGFGQGFDGAIDGNSSILALPPGQSSKGDLRDNVLKPGYEHPSIGAVDTPKLDGDLDGKINAGNLSKLWSAPDVLEPARPVTPGRQFSFRAIGQSITSQVIRRPDGTMEQRQTVTDSEGNTETTVTRQIGDKTHTVKTRKDKNGVETTTEDLINIDQDQLMDFENKWKPVVERPIEPGTLDSFPWHKFFSFNPKL